jgi:TrmH family RNA methyltransferase
VSLPPITSRQNPLVARFRESARGNDSTVVLLDGIHLVSAAIDAGLRIREVIVAADAVDRPDVHRLVEALATRSTRVAKGAQSVMDAVSPVRSASNIVALADRPIPPTEGLYRRDALLLIVADLQDPGNLGAIVRVAEAGGAAGAVVAGASANPFGWKALRASMASALRLPIAVHRETREAISEAQRHGYRILATAPRGGVSYTDANFGGSTAIVIGGEGAGLPSELLEAADQRLTIPMAGGVESLNAAVAAAILVYEARRQREI